MYICLLHVQVTVASVDADILFNFGSLGYGNSLVVSEQYIASPQCICYVHHHVCIYVACISYSTHNNLNNL